MKYYLIKETTWFYDPHGTPDFGGETKEVIEDDEESGITIDGTYISGYRYNDYLDCKDEEMDLYFDDDDETDFEYYLKPDDYDKVMKLSGQDGYNCEETDFEIKEISEEQYNRYKEIINEYSKI
jgi:hypothetical protein